MRSAPNAHVLRLHRLCRRLLLALLLCGSPLAVLAAEPTAAAAEAALETVEPPAAAIEASAAISGSAAIAANEPLEAIEAIEAADAVQALRAVQAIEVALAADATLLPAGTLHDPQALRDFYVRRSFLPAWQGERCEPLRSALLTAIEASASHGLRPQDYHLDGLAARVDCDVEFELLATDAWLLLGAHLHGGRVDPLSVEPDWSAVRPGVDLQQTLQEALDTAHIAEALHALAPQDGYYAELREVLAAERLRPVQPAAPQIEDGPSLRPGDSGPRVAQLRARLRWLGALAEPVERIEAMALALDAASRTGPGFEGALAAAHAAQAAQLGAATSPAAPERAEAGQAHAQQNDTEHAFDPSLELLIRELQQRANLEPDGVVGPQTLALLQRDRAARIDQLRVNLERWRWLPRDLGERHIRVNIADFSLEARASGRVEQVHPVIVGSRFRRTPSFSAPLRYVVLSPWWEVPRTLAVEDKLPLFRRDPGAFSRLGFELLAADGSAVDASAVDFSRLSKNYFPYRLRQRPGPANALGQAKLILPNRHSVYLHDTPTRGLFSRVRRDFSSGCIRVENVTGLVAWALAETPGWDAPRIAAELAARDDQRVNLIAPIPVHLLYLTVVADAARGVRYLDDLYGRDPALLAALDAAARRQASTSDR